MSYSLSTICPFQESKGPKATISVKGLNATFQPEKIGHAHGLQISYSVEDHTRNLFVYHKNGRVNLWNFLFFLLYSLESCFFVLFVLNQF